MSDDTHCIDDEMLRNLVPISALPDALQDQIRALAECQEVEGGQILFRQGTMDDLVYYLLKGQVTIEWPDGRTERVTGGEDAARHPLAPGYPRPATLHARLPSTILRIARPILDTCLFWAQTSVSGITSSDGQATDWVMHLSTSGLFRRIPPANVHKVFSLFEAVRFRKGDTVVRQGDAGDYYYVIQQGRCAVSRLNKMAGQEVRVAELRVGQGFGEEALVADVKRNATVTMLEDGVLRRLSKASFATLVQAPMLRSLSLAEARDLTGQGNVTWIDVRLPDEHAKSGIKGSHNVPLPVLRQATESLPRERRYVVYCDTGRRSAVGTFLLAERGFDAFHLEGGIANRRRRPSADAAKQPGFDETLVADEASRLKMECAEAQEAIDEAITRHASMEAGLRVTEKQRERLHAAAARDMSPAVRKALEERLAAEIARYEQALRQTRTTLENTRRRRLQLRALSQDMDRISDAALLKAITKGRQLQHAAINRLEASEKTLEQVYEQVSDGLAAQQHERKTIEADLGEERARLEKELRSAREHMQSSPTQDTREAMKKAKEALALHEERARDRLGRLSVQERRLRREGEQRLENQRSKVDAEVSRVVDLERRLQALNAKVETARRQANTQARALAQKARAQRERQSRTAAAERERLAGLASAAHKQRGQAERDLAAAKARREQAAKALAGVQGADGDPSRRQALEAVLKQAGNKVDQAEKALSEAMAAEQRMQFDQSVNEQIEDQRSAVERSLQERLKEELNEWLEDDVLQQEEDSQTTQRLQQTFLRIYNETEARRKQEEEATEHMLDEVHEQLMRGD